VNVSRWSWFVNVLGHFISRAIQQLSIINLTRKLCLNSVPTKNISQLHDKKAIDRRKSHIPGSRSPKGTIKMLEELLIEGKSFAGKDQQGALYVEEGGHTFGASNCKSIIPHHNRPFHNCTSWHATTTQDISWDDRRAVKAGYFSDILRAILNSRSSSPLHDPPTLKVVLVCVDARKMRTWVESFVRASEGEFIAAGWVSSVWTRRHNNSPRATPIAFTSIVSRGAIRQDDLILAPHPQAHILHHVIENVLCIRELQHRHLGLAFTVLRTFVVLRTAPTRTTRLTWKTAAIPFRTAGAA
jgi:hypothetical protein